MKVEYTCEICGKKYSTAKAANECEKKHENIQEDFSYYTCEISFFDKTIQIKKINRDTRFGRARLRFGQICQPNGLGQKVYFNIKKRTDFEETYNKLLPEILMVEQKIYEVKSNLILTSIEKLENTHKELIDWFKNYTKTQTPIESNGENEKQ